MNERDWQPQRFTASDIADLAQLGAIVSGENSEVASVSFLRWQNLHNPAGEAIIWLARHLKTGQLVGSYAVIPILMKVGYNEVIGSLSLNTMTHPDFRKQGIFKTLATLTYETCVQRGIVLTIGFPNNNSYHGFTEYLRFIDIGQNEILIRILRFDSIIECWASNSLFKKIILSIGGRLSSDIVIGRASIPRNIGKHIIIKEIWQFDDQFNDLWDRNYKQTSNAVVRTSEYLNWRFTLCPTRKYKVFAAFTDSNLIGYVVAIISTHLKLKDTRVAYIVDAFVEMIEEEGIVWRELIASIETWARTEHAGLIMAYVPSHLHCFSIMKKVNYRSVPKSLRGGLGAFIVRCHLPEKIQAEKAMSFCDWYLMSGDNDYP